MDGQPLENFSSSIFFSTKNILWYGLTFPDQNFKCYLFIQFRGLSFDSKSTVPVGPVRTVKRATFLKFVVVDAMKQKVMFGN